MQVFPDWFTFVLFESKKLCISVCCFFFFFLCVWDAFHVRLYLCWMVQFVCVRFFLSFSCSTVPVIHSTEAGLRRVLCDQFPFLRLFFSICMFFYYYPFFLLFVIDVFFSCIFMILYFEKKRDRTIEYIKKHIEIYALG
jgi:hypothetical protein